MKSSTKKWFITAGILIIIGIMTGLTVFAASGFKLSEFVSADNRVKKEYEIQRQDAVNLNINTLSSDIVIKESDDQTVKITCYESDRISFDTSANDGTLKIEEKDNRKWYEFLMPFINIKDTSLIIELPKDNWENITLSSSSGEIKADSFDCLSFSSDTTSGDIYFSEISAENEIKLDTTSGEIILKDSNAETIHSESTSGDIFMYNIENAALQISSTSGEISITNASNITSLSAGATSGDIEIHSLFADKIGLETVSGEIEFSNIDADTYKMTSTSGDIEGTIAGDETSVTFFTDTVSGDISVPYPSMGDKTFTAETVSGDIEVRFQK